MKKVIFVRHGKAEDGCSGISDFERSLTVKGKIICRDMARRFLEKEKHPGLFITSPAFRALETSIIFASEFGIKPESIRIDSNLYYKAGIRHLKQILNSTVEDINTITLFGHNPSFTEMPDRLCIDGCECLPKTSIVCISFIASAWQEVEIGSGRLEYFLKPLK